MTGTEVLKEVCALPQGEGTKHGSWKTLHKEVGVILSLVT